MKSFILGALATSMVLMGCGRFTTTTTSTDPTTSSRIEGTFSSINANIIQRKCLGCHSASSGSPGPNAGGFNQDSFENIRTRVVAGDATSSPLYTKVTNPVFGARMPLGRPPLSAAEIAAIRDWINDGALDN